jgi:hypothetical protein
VINVVLPPRPGQRAPQKNGHKKGRGATANAMAKARIGATSFTPINDAPEHGSINILNDKTIKVAAAFKNNQ